MGSYTIDYKTLFLSVLTDWRVIAIAVLILLAWALLRYVGLVFKTSSGLKLPAPKAMKKAKSSKAAKEPTIEIEE